MFPDRLLCVLKNNTLGADFAMLAPTVEQLLKE